MLVTEKNREEYLRTKNRFYIAGWVASELSIISDTTLKRGAQAYTRANPKYRECYEDYISGYSDQYANAECLSNRG